MPPQPDRGFRPENERTETGRTETIPVQDRRNPRKSIRSVVVLAVGAMDVAVITRVGMIVVVRRRRMMVVVPAVIVRV